VNKTHAEIQYTDPQTGRYITFDPLVSLDGKLRNRLSAPADSPALANAYVSPTPSSIQFISNESHCDVVDELVVDEITTFSVSNKGEIPGDTSQYSGIGRTGNDEHTSDEPDMDIGEDDKSHEDTPYLIPDVDKIKIVGE
jgi:hypothetical protein